MKVILIDDEQLVLNHLERQLLAIADIQIVGKYTDPLLGKQAIERNDVDLVFLDIQILELNGLDLAEQLWARKPGLHIVFVTAYDQYAIRAFELNALDYVLKPVSKQRLLNTIQRVQYRVKVDSGPTFQKIEILQMNMFQQVTILTEEQEIHPLHWRTAKVEQLFLYLVQHRGQTISKTVLIELLWPELEPKKAYQQLYIAVYHLRKTLGAYGQHFNINTTTEGYFMKLEQINLDVEQFEQFVQSGLILSAETIDDYEQALSLYTGDYLQGHDYVWVESKRQRLQLHWVRTALKMVNWYYSNDQLEKAMSLCLDICHRYPLEEEAYFFLMKIFATMGKHSSVHQQYIHLQNVLLAELEEQPSPFTTEWYQQWKQRNKE